MVIGFAAACLFLLAGLYFIRGRGAALLLRLHAVPEEDNGTYDPSKISRFIGLISLLFSLGAFLWWLGKVSGKNLFLTAGLAVWIGTALFILIYLNTGERFWTPSEDYIPFSSALEQAEESAAEEEASEHIEELFASVSVRGRVAYGAACLEKAADALTARTPRMEEYLEFLWSFTSTILFDEWEERAETFRAQLEDFSAAYGLEELAEEDKVFLYYLQRDSLEAAVENLKNGEAGFTLEPTVRLIKAMWKNGFELPSMHPFLLSSAQESGGWGDPRAPEFFRQQIQPKTEDENQKGRSI